MKCADIPDQVFLDAVVEAARLRGLKYATRWDVAAVLAGHPEHVLEASVADYAEMPQNVVLAKARKLIRRGRLEGCICGCRGDLSVSVPTLTE